MTDSNANTPPAAGPPTPGPGGFGAAPSDRDRAIACYNTGRFADAARFAQRALATPPREDGLVHILGASLIRIGNVAHGTSLLRELCERGCPHPEAWCDLANGLRATEDIEGAHRALDQALALRPLFPPAVRGKIALLHGEGRARDGARMLDAAIRANPRDVSNALAFAMIARDIKRANEAIELLQRHTASGAVPAPLVRPVLTELARLLDAEGRYDEAFAAASAGAKSAGPIGEQDFFEAKIAQWTPAYYSATPTSGIDDPTPVLVLGMPRSGTSLVEQILTSHPAVGGIGEGPALPRIEQKLTQMSWPAGDVNAAATEYLAMMRARCPGKSRVIDKLPGNYTILGPITRILPGASVIYCVRDARDTCLSCHFQNFGTGHSYARDLALLGRKYVAHEKLMAHWRNTLGIRVLEVRYEDLVADLEGVARRMLEHIGVEWDPRVLEFHLNTRHMRTASAGQVHRPIFTSSVGRWKHYERHLGPLLQVLGPRD